MRLSHILLAALIAIGASVSAQAMSGSVPGQSVRAVEANPLVLPAKIKCRVTEDGDFICTNKKKDQSGGGGNKCAGKNNCGSGFRDLERPNKYGACCEQIPTNSCDQGCKNHCTNSFVPGSQKWKSCVAGCGC